MARMNNTDKDAWARLELIRWKLKHGQLPRESAQKIWAGYGRGAECAACGRRIKDSEVEYELEFASLMHLRPVRLHRTCCDVWNAERLTFNFINSVAPYRTERPQ
jgi:hypothetical protein